MIKRIARIFLVLLLAPILVMAAPVASPSESVTYEQYQQLVQQKTAEVPELQTLWNWARKENVNDVYLGGGILRGLLQWININLENGGLEGVKKLQTPGVATLLIQKDADMDIFASDRLATSIKQWQPYRNWDVLNETFYQQSVANQGPTFDRIRVNIQRIDDPLNALHDFYEGKLTFRTDGAPFSKKYDAGVFGDNWLNLALRYLRFTQDLRSVVDGDPAATEQIRNLARSRASWIPTNTEFQLNWPTVKNAELYMAFRIRKALNKLYKSTRGDDLEFLRVLQDHQLLEMLSGRHFNVVSFDHARFAPLVDKVNQSRSGYTGLQQFAKMQCLTIPRCIEMHRSMFTKAKTPADSLLSLLPLREKMSDAYRSELANFWVQAINSNPKLRLPLDAKSVKELEVKFNNTDFSMAVKNAALRSATNVGEMLGILESAFSKGTETYKSRIAGLAKANLSGIASHIQTAEQLRQFELMLNNFDQALEAKRIAIKRAEPAEAIRMVHPVWTGGNSGNYQAQCEKLKTELSAKYGSVESALAQGVSLEQLRQLNPKAVSVDDQIREHEARLARATNPSEAFLALKPFSGNSTLYFDRLAEIHIKSWASHEHLKQFALEDSQLRELELTFRRADISRLLKTIAARSFKLDLQKLLVVLEPVTNDLKSVSSELAVENINKLIALAKTSSDLSLIETLLGPEHALIAKKKMLEKAGSSAEFLSALTTKPKFTTDTKYAKGVAALAASQATKFFSHRPSQPEIRQYFAATPEKAQIWSTILHETRTYSQTDTLLALLAGASANYDISTRTEILDTVRRLMIERGYSFEHFNQTRARLGFLMISRTQAEWPSTAKIAQKRTEHKSRTSMATGGLCIDFFGAL